MNCSPPGSSVHGIFPRQEYWSGLPFPSPGGLPDPGIEPRSPALAGGFFTGKPPGKPQALKITTWKIKKHPLRKVVCIFLSLHIHKDKNGRLDGNMKQHNVILWGVGSRNWRAGVMDGKCFNSLYTFLYCSVWTDSLDRERGGHMESVNY